MATSSCSLGEIHIFYFKTTRIRTSGWNKQVLSGEQTHTDQTFLGFIHQLFPFSNKIILDKDRDASREVAPTAADAGKKVDERSGNCQAHVY